MESHGVEAAALGAAERSATYNTPSLRTSEDAVDIVGDHTVEDLPGENHDVSPAATLQGVEVESLGSIPGAEVCVACYFGGD